MSGPGSCCNLIITRGLGCSRNGCNRLVTQGYGGSPKFVPEAIRKFAYGRRPDERMEEVIVWAKLLEINGKAAPRKIEGFIRVPVEDKSSIRVVGEHVSKRVRQAWEDIRVIVKRVKWTILKDHDD